MRVDLSGARCSSDLCHANVGCRLEADGAVGMLIPVPDPKQSLKKLCKGFLSSYIIFLTKSGNATPEKTCPKSFDGDFAFFDHLAPQVDLLLNEYPGLFWRAFLQLATQLCHASFDLRRI